MSDNESFVVQTVHTPCFVEGWHQHIEYELILFTEGEGYAFIGNEATRYEAGDIFFMGSQLPHMFKQKDNHPISAVLIHFREDCWGAPFINMPECRYIKQLLETAGFGLQLTGNCLYQLQSFITSLEKAMYANRIILLLQCLQIIANTGDYIKVSTQHTQAFNHDDNDNIDKVIEFTRDRFHQPVSLAKVAAVACMSVPSFCLYFKRRMQKTYIDFLNEVRVNYACRQLRETFKPVTDIGYESGYNTVSHFHRQFLKLKQITPLQYRKTFSFDPHNSVLMCSLENLSRDRPDEVRAS